MYLEAENECDKQIVLAAAKWPNIHFFYIYSEASALSKSILESDDHKI